MAVKGVSKNQLERELARRQLKAEEDAKRPKFSIDTFCFDKQIIFIKDTSKFKTAVCSRRCLSGDTLVMTTTGPKRIDSIQVGDYVYSEHGKPIRVLKTFDNGPKPTVDAVFSSRVLFSTTKDHVFLTKNSYDKKIKQKAVSDLNSRDSILRVEVDRNFGIVNETAYALAALLGDGCSTEDTANRLYISAANDVVPSKVAKILGADFKKLPSSNYSWKIYTDRRPLYYNEWCSGKRAHTKTCDLATILSWDRVSRLQFLAGLIDTDGSVYTSDNSLSISFGMQSKEIVEAAAMLFLDLFQYHPTIHVDDRSKYKNGPVYYWTVKNNYFSKKALKQLDKYLVVPSKKWKSQYSELICNNFNPESMKLKFVESGFKNTYDIHVDSDTNLYLLANGLVTHNSGKTVSCAADLISTCIEFEDIACAYITLNSRSAKRIIWRDLQRINDKFELGAKFNNVELTVTFPNGSVIYLTGATDEADIEKLRGLALKKVYIDEAQAFRPYIKTLIDDIIVPTLYDFDGSLILIGTPGPTCAGYFFEACHGAGWSHHKWTMFDNPHMKLKSGKDPKDIIAAELKRRGVTEDDPTHRRENLGEWVPDNNALVFAYNKDKNRYTQLPAGRYDYIFGIDIGYVDADAIAVMAYSHTEKICYLVEELVTTKQSITDLVNQIKYLKDKYAPVKMVMDAGALGKKIQEEIRQRHGLHIEAAEKSRKMEFIELMNDDLRTGMLKAPAGSRFEEDCSLVQWDRKDPSRLKISDIYHTDIGDAVLYAWRECRHYNAESDPVKHPKNSDPYMKELERLEAQKMKEQQNRSAMEDILGSQEDMDSLTSDLGDPYGDS